MTQRDLMTDRVTANLPSRDFDKTAAFYQSLGFSVDFKDDGWMILSRGPLEIEFFPHKKLKPRKSWFSASVRVNDLDALYAAFQTAGLSSNHQDIPRLTPPDNAHGLRMFALVDPDGSLLRCSDNRSTAL